MWLNENATRQVGIRQMGGEMVEEITEIIVAFCASS